LDDDGLKLAAEQYRQQLEQYGALFAEDGLEIKLAVYFVSIGKLVIL
ncbi:MAG: UvrD/REP helicase, partial [Pseudomonadota bacterium]